MMKIIKNGVLHLGFLLILGFMFFCAYRILRTTNASESTATDAAKSVTAQVGSERNAARELIKSMVTEDDYNTFVKKLGANINDPKFKAALEAGNKIGDKVKFDLNAAFTVGQLVPTQSEIDVDKSLKYPLVKEKPEILRKYLAAELDSEETFAPGGAIITTGARYVIDGHHRWSQLFLINPKIKIKAVNMEVFNPQNALKFTQMAIASVTGKIPVEKVEGKNLFTMSKDDFVTWVKSQKISDDIFAVFKEFGIGGVDAIIEYVWKNVEAMRIHNAPIKNASPRNLMPQTDTAKGWVEALEKGKVTVAH